MTITSFSRPWEAVLTTPDWSSQGETASGWPLDLDRPGRSEGQHRGRTMTTYNQQSDLSKILFRQHSRCNDDTLFARPPTDRRRGGDADGPVCKLGLGTPLDGGLGRCRLSA